MRKRIVLGLLGVAGALAMAAPASAALTDNFTFDPDGAGSDAAIANVKTFDWNVDNSLSIGATVAIENFLAGSGPVTFNTYYHASLSRINNVGGTNVTPTDFVSGTKELTIVAGFQEQVVGVTSVFGGIQVQFITTGAAAGSGAADAAGNVAANYAEVWYDPTKDANALAGTGYRDGTLILAADVDGFNFSTGDGLTDFTRSTFATPLGGPYVNLDANGTDDYPTIDSVLGQGSTKLTATPTFQHGSFFLSSLLQLSLFNTTNTLNFTQVDPSGQFDGQAGTLVLNTDYSLGSVDGEFTAFGGGNSTQFQADGNQSFLVETAVPEPVTAGLSIIGLAGLGVATLRRRRA